MARRTPGHLAAWLPASAATSITQTPHRASQAGGTGATGGASAQPRRHKATAAPGSRRQQRCPLGHGRRCSPLRHARRPQAHSLAAERLMIDLGTGEGGHAKTAPNGQILIIVASLPSRLPGRGRLRGRLGENGHPQPER